MMYRYPFPANPNGWFQIALSRDLAPGQVTPLRFFGRELVMFRTENGRAAVLDAYCAHQGAHMGIGGRVIGDNLSCPFHAWCYDHEGTCASIPFATKIPAASSVRAWPVEERNGIVWIYHHTAGLAPDWQLPEYGLDDTWTPLRSQSWVIRVHCQEIGENAVDTAHLLHVHSQEPPSNREVVVDADGTFFHVKQHMRMGEGLFGGMEFPVHTTTCGPGVAVLRVSIGPVETLSFIAQTPIDDERVTAWVNFAMKKLDDPQITEQVSQTYAGFLNEQYTQDIPIWENKIYRHKPPLSSADGPITAWRKWYRQFYSWQNDAP